MGKKRSRRMLPRLKIRNMIKINPSLMACKLRLRNPNQSRTCKLKKMLIRKRLDRWQQHINPDISIERRTEGMVNRIEAITEDMDNNNNIKHNKIIPPINGFGEDKMTMFDLMYFNNM